MTEAHAEVFISYKSDDESRVIKLVSALQTAGFTLWWDRHLAAGESWHAQIQAALDAARCVIVIWTHDSIGPAGGFVRDEATLAKRRGILVPVLFDAVDPPLGFGEIQAIDLIDWQGSPADPFFADLCAAITARLNGEPVPPAQAPAQRLRRQWQRRLVGSGLAATIGFGSITIGFNLFSVNDQLCSVSAFQPQLSDLCGAVGIGNRPTQQERLAWESREPGSCEALRAHVERFPQGALRGAAADLLAARRITQTQTWLPATRELTLFVTDGGEVHPAETAARAAASRRAQHRAEQLCKGFAATGSYRLVSAAAAPQIWHCKTYGGGVGCGYEGDAICAVEERRIVETESCGNLSSEEKQ
jgi:hypothetical protein